MIGTFGLAGGVSAGPEGGTAPATASVEFSAEPVVIESIGMQLYLPLRSGIQTRFIRGGQSRSLVQPEDQSWVMYIENKVSESDLAPAEILEGMIAFHQEPFMITNPKTGKTRSAVEVIDRTDDLEVGGVPAARAYIGQPKDRDYPVTGYTVLRLDPKQYVVFQFTTPLPNFPQTRTIFEAVTATAHFPDRAEIKQERVGAIQSGRDFLTSIAPEDLESVLDEKPMFMRVYRASASGATSDAQEIGYQRITVRKGQLGELDPAKPRTAWTVDEREYGFLVRMDARVLFNNFVVDTRGIFFLSRDRESEMWSIVIEEKGRDQFDRVRVNRTTQTLARRGAELRVQTARAGGPPEEKVYEVLEDHYLSAVERYVLPRLVARDSDATGRESYDLAFYNFDPQRSVVTLRREAFERTPQGGWLNVTTPSEGQPSWNSTYDAEGRLVQRTVPGAMGETVFEPTTRQRLQRIWSEKDLPIE